jgi:hypothetical protein
MTCVRKRRQVARPENHVRVPTKSIAASVRNACSKAVMSAFSKPAMYWSSNARARGSVGSVSRGERHREGPRLLPLGCRWSQARQVGVQGFASGSRGLPPSPRKMPANSRTKSPEKNASQSRLVTYDSPVASISTHGENGIAAAGRGRLRSRARSWVVIASPPPQESPVNAMCLGLIPWSSSHR